MSASIRFLEKMGSDPTLDTLCPKGLAALLQSQALDPAQSRALQDRDYDALREMLGGRKTMYCMIWRQPEPAAPGQEDQDDDHQDEQLPEQEPQQSE